MKNLSAKRVIQSISSGTAISKDKISKSGLYPVYGGGSKIGYCSDYNCDDVVLVGRVGSCGHITLVKDKCWATDNALIIKTKGETSYLAYLLTSTDMTPLISQTAMPLLTSGKIKELILPYTFDITEQRQIVHFLDRKCSAIDTAIEKTKESIEKLEEYKKAVITEAVTKGLDPDAKMKDSGVEWIGEVPEGWKIIKTKYLFLILKRIAGEEGYDVISITQNGLKIRNTKSNEGQVAADYSNYQFVYPGDFAMNHMDLLTGWVDLSTLFGVTSPDYRVFRRISEKVNNDYYRYVFQSLYFNKVYYGLAKGVAEMGRKRLQAPVFKDVRLPFPPSEEQKVIADYIDQKCTAINHLIAKKQETISKWEEYKKSLIYYAVTGKIDCRNEVL